MNLWLLLQVYLSLQVSFILREMFGPALREKTSLIRNSNDHTLVFFSCSIYFHSKNVSEFYKTKLMHLWPLILIKLQTNRQWRILLWKYLYLVGSAWNAGPHNEKKYVLKVNFMLISGTMKIIQLFYLSFIAINCFTVYRTHFIFKGMPIYDSIWPLRNDNLYILNIAYINKLIYKGILKNF